MAAKPFRDSEAEREGKNPARSRHPQKAGDDRAEAGEKRETGRKRNHRDRQEPGETGGLGQKSPRRKYPKPNHHPLANALVRPERPVPVPSRSQTKIGNVIASTGHKS